LKLKNDFDRSKKMGLKKGGGFNFAKLFLNEKKTITPKKLETGLYHGGEIAFGNQKCFSDKKWRRKFDLNINYAHLFSEVLNKKIKVKVTPRAIRAIDLAGGLDSYLLNTSKEKIASRYGNILKNQIKEQKIKVKFFYKKSKE
jgi:large subunit ribosomal protein L28